MVTIYRVWCVTEIALRSTAFTAHIQYVYTPYGIPESRRAKITGRGRMVSRARPAADVRHALMAVAAADPTARTARTRTTIHARANPDDRYRGADSKSVRLYGLRRSDGLFKRRAGARRSSPGEDLLAAKRRRDSHTKS